MLKVIKHTRYLDLGNASKKVGNHWSIVSTFGITSKLIISVLTVQLCFTLFKGQTWQSLSINPSEYLITQQLRIARISLRLMKDTKCHTIFHPNKYIFEAAIYLFKRNVISVKKIRLQSKF